MLQKQMLGQAANGRRCAMRNTLDHQQRLMLLLFDARLSRRRFAKHKESPYLKAKLLQFVKLGIVQIQHNRIVTRYDRITIYTFSFSSETSASLECEAGVPKELMRN